MKGYLMNSHMNQRVPLFDHPVRMSFMFELNTRKWWKNKLKMNLKFVSSQKTSVSRNTFQIQQYGICLGLKIWILSAMTFSPL